jgi:hypothetical protein
MPTPGHADGHRPKLFATGIAPLGVISIGIVPMGVVAIGVVPMGVFSLGAVGMGLVSVAAVNMGVVTAGITTMGVAWAGLVGMGPIRLQPPAVAGLFGEARAGDAASTLMFPTRQQAEARAKQLGCSGAHPHGPGGTTWMPCSTMEDFLRVHGGGSAAGSGGHQH